MSILGPAGGVDIYRHRRNQLMRGLDSGAAILFAGEEPPAHFGLLKFRQESHFYYLTGFNEPESAVVINPMADKPVTMFVRDVDPKRLVWDGFHYGLDGTKKYFGVDQVFSITELEKRLPEVLGGAEKIF